MLRAALRAGGLARRAPSRPADSGSSRTLATWTTTRAARAAPPASAARRTTQTARFSSAATPFKGAAAYLVEERGLSEAQAAAVLEALRDSGAGSSDGTLKNVAKGIDDSSLSALVKAVDEIAERNSAREALEPATLEVDVPRDGYKFTIEGRAGDSLFSLVEHGTELAEYIECACQGQLMCSTCHVYVDEECLKEIEPADEYEQDMIDIAYEPRDNSRLGCQLKLKPGSTLKIQIPEGTNNYFN